MTLKKGLILAYVSVIYALIPFARSLQGLFETRLGLWLETMLIFIYVFFLLGSLIVLRLFKKEKNFCPYGTILVIGIILAFFLTKIDIVVEKIHFLEYAVLGVLLILGFRSDFKSMFRMALSLLSVGVVIGFFDEWIQGKVPDRFFDWRDVAMNGVGVGMGISFELFSKLFHHDS